MKRRTLYCIICTFILLHIPVQSVRAVGEKAYHITFGGDIILDGSVKDAINKYGPDYPFQKVKREVQKADFALLTMENPITYETKKDPIQLYNFKGQPLGLKGIKNAGFDLINLGNNHLLDYGRKGLLDTFRYLKKEGIPYIGAGVNAKEAYKPYTIKNGDKKIKIMSMCRFLPSGSWWATNSRPGVANAYEADKVKRMIKQEKKGTDYLIVYMHWGKEKVPYPLDNVRAQAKMYLDAGADAIVASHPHVLQGFEFYKGKPIAYAIGNFVYPSYVHGPSAETGLLKLTLQSRKIGMEFAPYTIRNSQIQPVSQKEKVRIWRKLQSLSYGVRIQNGKILSK